MRYPLGWLLACSLGFVVSVSAAATSQKTADPQSAQFLNPPDSAKPWVYWFVMDGNLTREGITADFEAMKRVGITGLIFMEVDLGIPKGPVKFMSPPWRELMKHANQEAARLGLSITVNSSPGWTGSGGPWVKPEQSMQKLVFSEIALAGPQRFQAALPQPPVVAGFYRDVAVLAFPTPQRAYRIEGIEEKALYRRPNYTVGVGGVRFDAFISPATNHPSLDAAQVVAPNQIVDLSDKLDPQGRLTWDVPHGKWTILRFGHTSTGAMTSPAPKPGLGLECDKLDKAALESHFNNFLGKLLADIGPLAGKSWIATHIDSWEMGTQNWTARFPAEFQKRRGYDLCRYLPVMTGRVVASAEVSERFLWDLRQTILELTLENYSGHLAELAHRHGLKLSIEPYDGTPCDDMMFGARADVPMAEFWQSGIDCCFSCTEASSIAHTYGKPIVQAEAFTAAPGEDWRSSPASLKALGDWAYCEGINRFVFHRYCHQPWLDRWPGMMFGPYGIHYERTQTWWEQSRAWLRYLSRCQFMLQQGLFVADICYLTPEASPHVFRPGPGATRGFPPKRLGYNFDGCTPEVLLTRAKVKDGRIVLADGMSYRVLVLPEIPAMTPRLLRKIKELVEAGATIVGPRPLRSPSLSNYPKCDEEVRQLADQLWGKAGAPAEWNEHSCGKGRVLSRRSFEDKSKTTSPESNPLQTAKWIWRAEGNPVVAVPPGTRYFRRVFNIESGRTIRSAKIAMTADNAFQLWVNGKPASEGQSFMAAHIMDVAGLLKPGVNVLAVKGDNGGDAPNPAALIGSLSIQFADGSSSCVNTDGKWEAAESVKTGWTTAAESSDGWKPAMELGPMGMAPWGEPRKPGQEFGPYPDYAVLADILAKMNTPPDFATDADLQSIHRRDGNTDIYFIANGQSKTVETICAFRAAGKTPEIWDAVTGEIRPALAFKQQGQCTTVPLKLAMHGSLFVVFREPTDLSQSQGQNFPEYELVQEIGGPWTVEFDPRWGGPASVRFDTLVDWTTRPEDGIKHYSGKATYRQTFTLSQGSPLPQAEEGPGVRAAGAETVSQRQRRNIYLNLGEVKDLAEVRVNGKPMGILWCAPWRIDISKAIRLGKNDIEIVVVNQWVNRLIGDAGLPPEKRLTWTPGNPYKADSLPLKSGLLGPVRIEQAK